MSLSQSAVSGPGYLRLGLQRIRQPGVRRFVLIPLALNLVLFASLIGWGASAFGRWMDSLIGGLPQWLGFLEWLMWPIFALAVLLALFFGFSVVANLIASPFYGMLAERVAADERGSASPDQSWQALLISVPRSLGRELRKLAYYLPRLLALLLLSLLPGINLLASPLLLLFGVWMMAVQYLDYQADNDQVGFNDMLLQLRKQRMKVLGFGLPVYFGLMLPLVNLLVMPAAVAGATLLWVREARQQGN